MHACVLTVQGVGVTVTSGVKYRNNAATDAGGTLTVTDLGVSFSPCLLFADPQSYFVKPFLKEHAFSPASATADLSVNPDSVIEFVATRVVQ